MKIFSIIGAIFLSMHLWAMPAVEGKYDCNITIDGVSVGKSFLTVRIRNNQVLFDVANFEIDGVYCRNDTYTEERPQTTTVVTSTCTDTTISTQRTVNNGQNNFLTKVSLTLTDSQSMTLSMGVDAPTPWGPAKSSIDMICERI